MNISIIKNNEVKYVFGEGKIIPMDYYRMEDIFVQNIFKLKKLKQCSVVDYRRIIILLELEQSLGNGKENLLIK
ncbi:hypothetical protein D7X88_17025 [bacterium C-53]|nr:hypothetical protein [Lachnospiraceae bacterium]NBI04657.1 hypothetical protein [Lachnospiraceae bacterium]RKJ07959.1 hypothetical protein D7X88_17025 [bacterium C-53]